MRENIQSTPEVWKPLTATSQEGSAHAGFLSALFVHRPVYQVKDHPVSSFAVFPVDLLKQIQSIDPLL